MKRKLTTILAADLVGYCRLIAFDEEGTIAALRDLLADVINPILATHEGQMFKTMGDADSLRNFCLLSRHCAAPWRSKASWLTEMSPKTSSL